MMKLETLLDRVPTAMRQSVRRNGRRLLLEASLVARKRETDRPPPDFVIVGAQRCGTTSLFRALAKHPAMMSNVLDAKGVHYFDTDFDRGLPWYLSHFPSRSDRDEHAAKVGQPPVVGEASPYYLFHPAGAERMARTIPDTRLVVLLRNPIKRAISHHLHMVWEGHEKVEDIDKALDLEATRLSGIEQQLLADPSMVSRDHQHYSYMARGHYAEQLERLFAHFDRDKVLVMATETLTGDSQASMERIQHFLGLEPDPATDLGKRNASARFEPRPETVERLSGEFAASNRRLADLVDIEIPWL